MAAPATQPVNLVRNGDFETASPSNPQLPADWTTKHPANVKYVKDTLDPAARGMVIEMTGDKDLMSGYGVDLLSDKMDVKPNTRCRCTGFTRSAGPRMIVFVKGYATIKGREEQIYQMRKEIAPTPEWTPFNLDFDVRPAKVFSDFQQKVEYLRITLWAYWPVGTCWYDDIRFEEVGPLDPSLVTNAEPVTHVGLPPNLATQPASPAETFDAEDLFNQAVNALNGGQDAEASQLASRLLANKPDNADYHLLAARALARIGKWAQADVEARWLIDHAPETWQREWGQVIHAQALADSGDVASAKKILTDIAAHAESESAKSAATEALGKMH